MPDSLILLMTFFAGFSAGCGMCAWRSYRRRLQEQAPERSRPPCTTFGHARRAF